MPTFLPGSWVWYRGSRGQVLHSTLTTVVLAHWRGCAETRAPRDACTPADPPLPQDPYKG